VKYKAIDIQMKKGAELDNITWLEFVWGADVFVNGVPIGKSILFMNIIVWIILYVTLR